MNVMKAIVTVVLTAIGFGVAGTGIGLILGRLAPSFLRYAVRAASQESLDYTELGLGLGLTNGLTWGLVIGTVIVAILAWKESRLSAAQR
ncbi:MAG: hypothetical protein IT424_02260 [Pirellulales bacterium]|nr:hypothetical protein [Pirellulales bacterium]